MDCAYNELVGGKELPREFDAELESLRELFEDAYLKYSQRSDF